MNIKLKNISTDLLLACNLEKVINSKENVIKFIEEIGDENLKYTIKPIIEDEFQKIIDLLSDDTNMDTMQQRLQIFYLLVSLNTLVN